MTSYCFFIKENFSLIIIFSICFVPLFCISSSKIRDIILFIVSLRHNFARHLASILICSSFLCKNGFPELLAGDMALNDFSNCTNSSVVFKKCYEESPCFMRFPDSVPFHHFYLISSLLFSAQQFWLHFQHFPSAWPSVLEGRSISRAA